MLANNSRTIPVWPPHDYLRGNRVYRADRVLKDQQTGTMLQREQKGAALGSTKWWSADAPTSPRGGEVISLRWLMRLEVVLCDAPNSWPTLQLHVELSRKRRSVAPPPVGTRNWDTITYHNKYHDYLRKHRFTNVAFIRITNSKRHVPRKTKSNRLGAADVSLTRRPTCCVSTCSCPSKRTAVKRISPGISTRWFERKQSEKSRKEERAAHDARSRGKIDDKNWDEQELTTHKVEGLTYDTGCCWWGGVGPGGNKACAHLHMQFHCILLIMRWGGLGRGGVVWTFVFTCARMFTAHCSWRIKSHDPHDRSEDDPKKERKCSIWYRGRRRRITRRRICCYTWSIIDQTKKLNRSTRSEEELEV